LLRSLKRLVPRRIRKHAWRARWLTTTEAYHKQPSVAALKVLWFTAREVVSSEIGFRAGPFRFVSMSNNVSSLVACIEGSRDPSIDRLLRKRLAPGGVFCDVGANIGTYTIPASALVGDRGKVLAFEPHPRTLSYLQRNVALNGAANVVIIGKALGSEAGSVTLVFDPGNAGETHVKRSAGETGIAVDVTTLDEELHALGVDRVDYLKIDVEGFELSVLHGASRTITANPAMMIQLEMVAGHAAEYGVRLDDVSAFLRSYGLTAHTVTSDGDLVPASGFNGEIVWTRF